MDKDDACRLYLRKEYVTGECPFCGVAIDPVNGFRDACSIREYWISGLCQGCQDAVFGVGGEPAPCAERPEVLLSHRTLQ